MDIARQASLGNKTVMVISGNNSSWTGGIQIASNAHVRLDNANAAGTGPINGYTGNSTLYFGTNATTLTLSQDVIGVSKFVNGDVTNPVTFSGNVISVGGLTLQGYASSPRRLCCRRHQHHPRTRFAGPAGRGSTGPAPSPSQ